MKRALEAIVTEGVGETRQRPAGGPLHVGAGRTVDKRRLEFATRRGSRRRESAGLFTVLNGERTESCTAH